MSVLQTVLVFAVVPLGLILVVAVLTIFRRSGRPPRYKPGKPWVYDALWYEPHPEPGAHGGGSAGEHVTGHDPAPLPGHGGQLARRQLTSGHSAQPSEHGDGVQPGALVSALAIGERPHGEQPEAPTRTTPVGTDRVALGTGPDVGDEDVVPARRTAAGGARGTW